jgi:trehalose 6-phosphate phosphatase
VSESSQRTDAPLSRAIALARDAVAEAPAGLLTDFDGTLSTIAPEPSGARLVDGAAEAVATLARGLAVVAIITGRAPLDARRLVGIPGLLIVGNHGMEWLDAAAGAPEVSPDAASVPVRLDRVLARIPDLPGVVPEHKTVSASVHYRGAPDPGAARAAILEALGDVEADGLRIGHGRMIVEVRPVGLGDKGSAVHAIVERFGLRGVVVMGDDLTDLDMFRAVDDLRASGGIRGAIVGVGGADHEVAPEVLAAADVMLADPTDAARFLTELAASI